MAWWRDVAYGAAGAISSPVWAYALWRSGKWRTDWAGRFGKVELSKLNSQGETSKKRMLFHAVSVGEVNAIRHLVSVFETQVPEVELVIAATTNTGFDRAMTLYADRDNVSAVVRYPLDFSCAVGRFLDALQPDLAVMVELELWPNFAEACERRSIPLAVVNGRLSDRSFKRYRLGRPWIRSTFARVAAAGVQTQAYADRFVAMGTLVDRVHVLDTMKWDTAVVSDHVEGAAALADEMGLDRSRPIVVAGSTSPGEEAMLVESLRTAGGFEQAQIVLAPRRPERFDQVAALFDFVVRRSQPSVESVEDASHDLSRAGPQVFLLDTMGELRKAYALADVCLVGRSFMGDLYGSDMMEPIALGKPTIIGPYYADFTDTMQALLDGRGIRIVELSQVAEAVAQLLHNPQEATRLAKAGRDVILSRRGATKRHVDMLLNLLK